MPILGSVGAGGDNRAADVFFVQLLLADWQARRGDTPIAVDGVVGSETVTAIRAFQGATTGVVDGRVDPGGPALERLEGSYIQGVRVNEITDPPDLILIPEIPLSPLPAEETPDRYFRKFLEMLREEL